MSKAEPPSDGAARAFLVVSLLAGAAFALITPPFQVPDEPAHLYSAYALSEGRISTVGMGDIVGMSLPASLQEAVWASMGEIAGNRSLKVTDHVRRASAIELDRESRRLIRMPGALYTPAMYLPSAAVIGVLRIAEARPLVMLCALRMTHLIVGTLLTYLALRMIPVGAWAFALVALTPMTMYFRASANPDALILAVATLLFALIVRAAYGSEARVSPRMMSAAIGCLLFLGLSKPPYVVLAALALLIPGSKFRSGAERILWALSFVAAGIAGVVASWWWVYANVAKYSTQAMQDAPAVYGLGVAEFPRVLLTTFGQLGWEHLGEAIGKFGWLDTPLPRTIVLLYLVSFVAAALVARGDVSKIRPGHRALAIGLAAFGTVAVYFIFFMRTELTSAVTSGVQGRYFIPFLLPAVLAILSRSEELARREAAIRMGTLAYAVAGLAVSLLAIAERFYGKGFVLPLW
jgi:uncharacterized membrane protein